jgi:hypothetical protein
MHVVATYDGFTSRIYINGEEDNSQTYPEKLEIGENTSDLLIASINGIQRWNGDLDDIRLYDGALTGSEVEELYAGFFADENPTDPPSPPGLLAPENTAENVLLNPELVWEASEDAQDYVVEVSEAEDFSSLFFTEETDGLSVEVPGLAFDTEYFWRVKARNHLGESGYSPVSSTARALARNPDQLMVVERAFPKNPESLSVISDRSNS